MDVEIEHGEVIEGVDYCGSFFERLKGLMGREGGRALLVFPEEGFHGIWMLGMQFAIDIAFIDAGKEVVSCRFDLPPLSFHPSTWRVYRPPSRCKYVLETEAGLLSSAGLEPGVQVSFNG